MTRSIATVSAGDAYDPVAADSKPLNFPRSYAFEVRELAEQREIFDTIRRRWVALTPEEWVRQHMVRYLTEDLEYPRDVQA